MPHTLHDALRTHGVRLTRVRRVLLDILAGAAEHLKAADLHRRARQVDPQIGLASVYRTLDLLDRLGMIQPIHTNHRHRHYAPLRREHGHHLVCTACGRIVEFADCDVEGLARRLARRTKFRIEGHRVELFGRCPACQPPRRKEA